MNYKKDYCDKKKELVILTMSYPFGDKETYLDNEMLHIEGFDKVVVIPCFPECMKRRECVVSNVVVIDQITNLLQKCVYIFRDIEFWKELLFIIKSKKYKIKCIKKLLWFSLRCQSLKNNLYNQINNTTDESYKVYFYSYWMTEPAFLAASIKKLFKDSIFVTRCHGYDIYEYRNGINYIPYRNFIFKTVDKIFAISNDGLNYLKSNYKGVDFEKKVQVSYLGTEVEKEPCYDLPPNSVLKIVSCSNIVEVKRIDRIINTLSMIDEFKIEWHHYGDGELAEKLLLLAQQKLDNKGNIKYRFCGRIDNKTLISYYKKNNYDLFINVSESEGLPVSIMEAMSCGIPVIATDVGGTSEIIYPNVNGFLINNYFSFERLKHYLLYYHNMNCEKRCIFRQAAFQLWNEKFNASNNYKQFYNSILDI